MFSRFASIFVLVGVFLTAGLGCKGTSTVEQLATKPRQLEWWVVYDDYDALQTIVQQFTASRPYISVEIKQIRPDELYGRLIKALAEDNGPDIVSVRNNALNGVKTLLSPMPAVFNDATVQTVRGTISSDTIIIPIRKQGLTPTQIEQEYVRSIKNDVVVGSSVYGLPLSLDTMGIFYNKDLLDRAQIAEPPRSWEELQGMVEKLSKFNKDGKIVQSGVALGTGNNISSFDDLLFVLFKQSNLEFMGRDGRPVFHTFVNSTSRGADSPAMQVINFYTDFANKDRKTYSWNEEQKNALDQFINGSTAFFFGYSYNLSAIRARAPQLNFGTMPLLQLNPENPVNVANYWIQTVTAKSKNKDAAWSLIDFVAHSSVTKQYLDATNRPSALRTYLGQQLGNTDLSPFAAQVLVADSWYHGANYDAARQALSDMIHEWLQPIPEDQDPLDWRQKILNRAASKVDQSL
jgi:ABC-type glycerol-3-phosphate transport system substrate-binding protein